MHTLQLKVQNSIYEHLMFLLKSINSKELEIVEDKIIKTSSKDNFDSLFDAISIDTRNFKFNRDEVNER